MSAEEFKAMSALEQIRAISGILNITGEPEVDVSIMTSRLALINLIARGELGLADKDFVSSQIDRIFGKKEEKTQEKSDENKT